MDYDPADVDNQFARVAPVTLASALDNASQIEVIVNDFVEADGNNELEIDNIEIVANRIQQVPETIGDDPFDWLGQRRGDSQATELKRLAKL